MACDTSEAGRSLFAEFAPDAKVFSSGNDFLHHIWASGETSVIHGYLINSYRFLTSAVTSAFWKHQLAIITQPSHLLLTSGSHSISLITCYAMVGTMLTSIKMTQAI